ncbi:MAG TPA: tRNA pseudouridine(55) synthase TruB [Rhabdochlamydiaceae bacterium]|nr:tRNA pseudouridine(55) synthase TruB [Rhabdochlamydiaceae bacterium]
MKNNNHAPHPLIQTEPPTSPQRHGGILLVNKPKGRTSFSLVSQLRRLTGIRKIGHAGTLDPFATGVMVMLIGKSFTALSQRFLEQDKEYLGKLHLGVATDSYDSEGKIVATSDLIPPLEAVHAALKHFQGTIQQIPPMFSAKKKGGKKLYELARKGITIEREAQPVTVHTQLISCNYPFMEIYVRCSKGTYIRSIANDLGQILNCGAHLCELTRMRSGPFQLADCIDATLLNNLDFPWEQSLYDHCR